MTNKILAILLICCLTYSVYSADCHVSCGGTPTDGTDCDAGTTDIGHCKTCATGTEKVLLAAQTDTAGTCTGPTVACSTPTDAKVFKTIGGTASTVIYFCIAPADIVTHALNTQGKVACATHSTTDLTGFFADINDYLNDCLTCASTDQTLLVTDLADTTGACIVKTAIQTTSPCALATSYLLQAALTSSAGIMTASTGWCVVNPTKCAICTAQGTAESALCSKYGFATADYSFATEAATAGKCAGCATANDWLQIATTLDKFGTCIAEASVAATCGAGKYGAKEDKNNALTYCAPDATSATLCFVCHTSTKCNTYSYTETVTFGAAAIKAFPFATASAEPNTFCLTCKAATDYPQQQVTTNNAADLAGTCVAFSTCNGANQRAIQANIATLGVCVTIATDDTTTPKRKQCTTWITQANTLHTSASAALIDCASCGTDQILFTADNAGASGYCVPSNLDTTSYCAANKFPVYSLNLAAIGSPDSRSAYCKTTDTKCFYCKASTNCATFFLAADPRSATVAVTTGYFFASEAQGEAQCMTCQNSKYVKITTAGDKGGSCVAYAGFSCTAADKEAIILDHTGFYICKVPSATNKEPCTTYYYGAVGSETPFGSVADALNACATCDTATQVNIGSGSGVSVGSCTNFANINTVCTNSKYLKVITANVLGYCDQVVVDANVGGAQAELCKAFYYIDGASKKFTYADNAAAIVACTSCLSDAHVSIAGSSTAPSGTCRLIANIQTVCGNNNYLQSVGTSATLGYCMSGAPVTPSTQACKTYQYISTAGSEKRTYTTLDEANQKCLTCDASQIWVHASNTAGSASLVGRCIDTPYNTGPACAAKYAVQLTNNNNPNEGYCIAVTDDAAVATSGWKTCDEFFYGELQFFPADFANNDILEYCYVCSASTDIFVKVPGEKRGRCYSTIPLAIKTCGASTSGIYLRKGTTKDQYSADVPFSYCQQTQPTPAPFKQCKTYFYNSDNWLDQDPSVANSWCATCDTNQLLLVLDASHSYGQCISSVAGACDPGFFIKKLATGKGICTQTTIATTQQYCKEYYYNGDLFIDDTAANAVNMCTACADGQYLLVNPSIVSFGQCHTKTPTAVATAGKFLQTVDASKLKVKIMTSPSCNTFNYNLNTDISARGSYIDLFEAMADCNTCPNSFAKIVGTFQTCEISEKCSTFQGASFDSLASAELKCTACNEGYIWIHDANVAFGTCQKSVGCSAFTLTTYISLTEAEKDCIACGFGFWLSLTKTCTASSTCLDSTTKTAAADASTFETGCNYCKEGYFRVAAAVPPVNPCTAIPAAANCLVAKQTVLDATTVLTDSCSLCKAGYYPKGTGFGTCTPMTLKHVCLEFGSGAASTEEVFGKTRCSKCPSEFYYNDGETGCKRCPNNCRICTTNPLKSIIDNALPEFLCSSCLDGISDLILYTNQPFGYCASCQEYCTSCSGIYVNTSPDFSNRKCETCGLATEITPFSTCKACSVQQPNCERCTGFGICAQCKPGFFFNQVNMQCVACKADCAICHDTTTCDVIQCAPGCKSCTAKEFAGCSQCHTGFYKGDSACVACALGCLECTSAGCTNPPPKGASCADNCLTCTESSSAPEKCTTPAWGYFINSVTVDTTTTVTLKQCSAGCKTCNGIRFNDCSECLTGFYRFDTGSVCDACHSQCASCTGPTLNECKACKPQLTYQTFLLDAFLGDQFLSCQICDQQACKTCGGKAPNPRGACTSCWKGNVLIQYEDSSVKNGPCVENCPADTFNDGGFCRRCILGSPSPCAQPPPAAATTYASFLTFSLMVIALIFMIL